MGAVEQGQSGHLTQVRWEYEGTENVAAETLGTDTFTVIEAARLSPGGVVWIGESQHVIVSRDEETNLIEIDPALTGDIEESTPVVPDFGGEPGRYWSAEVVLPDSETPLSIPLEYGDLITLPEGDYDPPRPIVVSDDLTRILDRPRQTPVIDGGLIDPDTLPAPPDSTDGLPPASSPTPTLRGGIGSLFLTWPATAYTESTVLDVYFSTTTPVSTAGDPEVTLVASSGPGIASFRSIGGTPVAAGTTYYVTIVARDADGEAAASTEDSATPAQATSDDILVGAITTDHLIANDALVDSLEAVGINADWITTGTLNADRISVGSTPSSSLPNANMEDQDVDPDGTTYPDRFAGWEGIDGTWTNVTQETTAPVSGTRSMKITLPTATDSKRMVSSRPVPVVPGQTWRVSAKVRMSRAVDTTETADIVAALTFHTSDGSVAPKTAHNGTTVVWQVVDALNVAADGTTVYTLDGSVVVPATHTVMQVSIYSGASNDGSGYSAVWDEVSALSATRSLNVVNADGEIVASINDEGDASFRDISFSGSLYMEPGSVDYGGESLFDRFDRLPRGLLASYAGDESNNTSAVTAETLMFSVAAPPLEEGRAYEFFFRCLTQKSVAGDRFILRLRYTTDGTLPTTTSPLLRGSHYTQGGTVWAEMYSRVIWHATATQENMVIGVFLYRTSGSGNALIYNSNTETAPTFTITDIGKPEPNESRLLARRAGSPQTPPSTDVTTYTKTYDANYGRWWEGDGTPRGDGDTLYFGKAAQQPGEGNRRTVLWFDEGAIRADLAGATVTKVESYLYKYSGGSGDTLKIGSHTQDAPTSNFGAIAGKVSNRTTVTGWNNGVGKWVDLPWALQDWKTTLAGILVWPDGINLDNHAASIRGATHSQRPKLRITYTK